MSYIKFVENVKETRDVYLSILLIINPMYIGLRYEIYQLVESLQINVLIINHHL